MKTKAICNWDCFITNIIQNLPYKTIKSNDKR